MSYRQELEGDEWKKQPAAVAPALSRADKQALLDGDYMFGKITRDEWSDATDKLSEPVTKGQPS